MSGTDPVVSDGAIEIRVADAFDASVGVSVSDWESADDITCDLLGDGLSRSTSENAVVIDRLCFKQTGERPGSFAEEVTLTYAWNPQDANTDTAYGLLTPYSNKALFIRYGADHGTSIENGDVIDVIEVQPGQQQRVPVARNEELRVTQKQFIDAGGVHKDVVIGAAPES